MNSVQPADPENTLDGVRCEYDRWRADRPGRARTPLVLRQRAVSLLQHHRAFHVCRALGINSTALKSWASENNNPDSGASTSNEASMFVALDAEPSSSEFDYMRERTSTLTVELPGRIRIRCESVQCVAELLKALGVRSATAVSS